MDQVTFCLAIAVITIITSLYYWYFEIYHKDEKRSKK